MQLAPNIFRLFLMNLNPMAKIKRVVNARTADMPRIAIQYNISNNCATVAVTSYYKWLYLSISDISGEANIYYTMNVQFNISNTCIH